MLQFRDARRGRIEFCNHTTYHGLPTQAIPLRFVHVLPKRVRAGRIVRNHSSGQASVLEWGLYQLLLGQTGLLILVTRLTYFDYAPWAVCRFIFFLNSARSITCCSINLSSLEASSGIDVEESLYLTGSMESFNASASFCGSTKT